MEELQQEVNALKKRNKQLREQNDVYKKEISKKNTLLGKASRNKTNKLQKEKKKAVDSEDVLKLQLESSIQIIAFLREQIQRQNETVLSLEKKCDEHTTTELLLDAQNKELQALRDVNRFFLIEIKSLNDQLIVKEEK